MRPESPEERLTRLCDLLDIDLLAEQAFACRYLASHGYDFCVHFGYENAVDKAVAHYVEGLEASW